MSDDRIRIRVKAARDLWTAPGLMLAGTEGTVTHLDPLTVAFDRGVQVDRHVAPVPATLVSPADIALLAVDPVDADASTSADGNAVSAEPAPRRWMPTVGDIVRIKATGRLEAVMTVFEQDPPGVATRGPRGRTLRNLDDIEPVEPAVATGTVRVPAPGQAVVRTTDRRLGVVTAVWLGVGKSDIAVRWQDGPTWCLPNPHSLQAVGPNPRFVTMPEPTP